MNPLLSIIKRIRDTYPPGLRVAAIGSRRLTKPQLLHMEEALSELAPNISLLRSGGAIGADTLAEVMSARHNIPAEIFLPSSRALKNRRLASNFQPYGEFDPYNYELQQEIANAVSLGKAPISYIEQASPAAYKLARERGLPERYIDLMARNMHQVFGPNLDSPSDLILAMPQQRGGNWHGGGTRHAMSAALDANIPVFDLSAPSHTRFTGVDPNLPLLQLHRAHTRGPVPNPSTYRPTPTPTRAPRQRAFNIVSDTGDYDVRAMRYNGRTMANTSPEDYGKRNSGWLGNPYTWSGNDRGSKLSIDDAINLFKRDFLAKIESDPAFRQAVLNLRGKRIGYYKPDAPQSHVQVILDWLESQAPSTPTIAEFIGDATYEYWKRIPPFGREYM